ncbi:MAG: hypothetical protein ABF449_05705 [Ethanoligenens sp.]
MANRNPQPIAALKPELLETVKQMLLSGDSYEEIAAYLAGQGIQTDTAAISQFAASLNADAAALHTAQIALRRMMNEIKFEPDLDGTEAMLRMASKQILSVLADTAEADWAKLDKSKLLSSTIGLVRAAAYKKRTDYAIRSATEVGINAVKSMLFRALAKERPELYRELGMFLDQKNVCMQMKNGQPSG